MTVVERLRANAARLRREASRMDGEAVFGANIWKKLADMHEQNADRLDALAQTQPDLPAVVDP
jgi:hypothetical protein